MKRTTSVVASLAVLCAVAHADIKWSRDLGASKKQARALKRLIFLDFYADW